MTRPHRHVEQTNTSAAAAADLLEDVLIAISGQLLDLQSWLPLVRFMPDTHRDGLGFVPAATRELMGKQYAREKRELREAQAAGLPVGRGVSRAPGNMAGWSLEAEIEMTLRHLIRFILRRQPDVTVPTTTRAEDDRTEDTVTRLGGMTRQIDTLRVATAVQSDLEHLVETCRRTLFGEDRMELGGDCPHCSRRTLVVYLTTGVIRCERPRDTEGKTPRCECDPTDATSAAAGASALCPCHSDPRHEHHWLRDRSAVHSQSWNALAGALKRPLTKEIR